MTRNVYEDAYNDVLLHRGEEPQRPYTPKQILLACMLLLLGVFAIALGVLELKNRINVPLHTADDGSITDILGNLQDDSLRSVADVLKDTDGDGLSDKEELEVYGTSPYLADTDSDGYGDKTEVESGNNPNCPSGQDCFGGALVNPDADTTTGTNDFAYPNVSGTTGVPTAGNIDPAILQGTATPQQVRNLIVASGADAAIVAQLSDAEVMALYQQTLDSLATAGAIPSGTGGAAASQLEGLSGAQIRALLVQQGIDTSLIDGLTDDQLQQLFMESVAGQPAP